MLLPFFRKTLFDNRSGAHLALRVQRALYERALITAQLHEHAPAHPKEAKPVPHGFERGQKAFYGWFPCPDSPPERNIMMPYLSALLSIVVYNCVLMFVYARQVRPSIAAPVQPGTSAGRAALLVTLGERQ